MWTSSGLHYLLSHIFSLTSKISLDPEQRSKIHFITPSPSIAKPKVRLLKEIIGSFVSRLSYEPPRACSSNLDTLQSSLKDYIQSWNLDDRLTPVHLHKTCMHAAAMAELSYHNHDFETKLQIARFTWFMLYLDDLAFKMPSALEGFQSSVLQKQPLEDKVLQHFVTHLADMYHFWDMLPANSIVCAALEFVNGCALENHTDIQSMVPCSSAPSWPYYLRAKTGVAPAYAFMIFTKEMHPKLSHFMQVIADINVFIDLTNDVLSFYKEFLASEEGNYILNRSLTHNKSPVCVLSEVADEAYAAYVRVSTTLKTRGTPEAYTAWMTFVHGYLAFHITQDRYRLGELNS